MSTSDLAISWPGFGVVFVIVSVLTYLLRRIIKGALVPAALMNARMADKAELNNHVVEENKELRESGVLKDKTISTLSDQLKEAMEAGRAATAALDALKIVAQQRAAKTGSGEPHDA